MNEQNKLYDLTKLRLMFDGHREDLLEVVSLFLESMPETLDKLNKSYDRNDLDGVMDWAHKLKSSIDLWEITDLKSDIRMIELYSRERTHPEELNQLIEKLNDILQKVILELREEQKTL